MIDLYRKLFINSKELEIARKIDSMNQNFFNWKNLGSSDELKNKLKERKEILKDIQKKWLNQSNDVFLNKIVNGDCLDYLFKIKPDSIDLFLSDIPYWISLDEWDVFHNNTNSSFLWTASEAQIWKSGFKKRWKPINWWNEEDKENNQKYEEWVSIWANMLFPIMKEGASIMLFWWRRTIHKAVNALENAGFLPKDLLFWEKNSFNYRNQSVIKTIARRWKFKITTEWILWLENVISDKNYLKNLHNLINVDFKSSRELLSSISEIDSDITKKFTYEILDFFQIDEETIELMNKWRGWKVGTLAPKIEPIAWLMKPYSSSSILDNILKNWVGWINIDKVKIHWKEPTNLLNINFNKDEINKKIHEAQKPIDLIKFLITLTTNSWDLILDPFMWSGTTAKASQLLNRNFIWFERDLGIYETSMSRF